MKIRLIAALGATLAAAVAQLAWSQGAPAPVAQTTKVEGTDNVYIFRYGNVQSMFVVTKDGVIATDPISYSRREASKVYVDEIRKVTDKPIKYLVYSHHHFDHIAGGKEFKAAGATIIAHQRAKERLVVLQDPYTPLPDRTISKTTTLNLGGTALELHYLGLNHSDSTLIMRLPKERIIFAVDVIPVGSVPGRAMVDAYPLEWEDMLKKVMAMDWDRLIPGHPGAPDGRLGNKKDVQDTLAFLQEASATVKEQARAGKCWEPAEKELTLPNWEKWPGYEQALPLVARRYCGLWGRGT